MKPFSKEVEVSGYSPVFDCVAERYGLVTASVFGVIWRHCQMYRGVCDASQSTLAKKLHLSRETLNKEIKKLCDAKLIKDLTPNLIGRPHAYQDTSDIVIRLKEEVVTQKHNLQPVKENHTQPIKPVTENHLTCDRESHKDTNKKQKEKKQTPPSGDILTYHMTDETDSEFDCFCGERIIIAQLENANAHCKECMQPIRVFNWLDVVAKKPPQKARRQESGSYNGLAGFDDKPFKAFCVLYGVPYEGLPVKKVRQWANELKKVADVFDVDAEKTYQAIKSIKDSEHSWKSFTSPYVTGFQELLGIMIARGQNGNNEPDQPSPTVLYFMEQTGKSREEVEQALKAQSE